MKAALLGVLVVGLVGCGSSSQTPTVTTPSVTVEAAATDDPCQVLTADEFNTILGTTFDSGEPTSDEARQIRGCTYTMTQDAGGVEVPVSIVDVSLTDVPGEDAYSTNLELAPSYFGGEPETIEVAGADKAYVVINEQTASPVLGMLVGDEFVLIQIGVEGATVEQATQLAQTAASRLG